MFSKRQSKIPPSNPPAIDVRLQLSSENLIKLAPYIAAAFVGGGAGLSCLLNYIQPGSSTQQIQLQPVQSASPASQNSSITPIPKAAAKSSP